MPLSYAHQRALTNYRRYHTAGIPDWISFLGARYTALVIIVAVLIATGAYLASSAIFAAFGAGVLVAAVLRDTQYYFVTRAVWPALDDVIDWQKVDVLLDRPKEA